ncbi:hypothetical protein [Corynebacterium aquilae]|uniref:Uncharacterized protein n=1 Tax=Corynebacterium aquilae DSM 44791 TaxID=1431546 RepID=A0A1L7CFU4_9CORY|nr:hypothetical protein [Corynebacterium aquilae]APT84653.1 hypothetical protein CAQU_05740 [Corynebacterium aquilae DSM 44791]
MAATALNDRQQIVLAWIAAGCPEDTTPPGNYKISARTLESHELVKIKGHGDAWRATVTARGKRVLAGTEPLKKSRKKGASTTTITPSWRATPYRPRVLPTDAETDALLGAITNAPRGYFRIKCDKDTYKAEWEPRLKAAERALSQSNPANRLVYTWSEKCYWSKWPSHLMAGIVEEVRFADASRAILAGTRKIGKYHPMLKHFEECKNFRVSKEAKPRAKRLLHVLFVEAEREGWTVEYKAEEAMSWQPRPKGTVFVGRSEIKVIEQHDKFEREPTKQEVADYNRYSWNKDRPMKKLFNHVPNGRLSLEFGYSRKLNDTKRSPTRLDDALEGYFTQERISGFFSRARADLEELYRKSYQRRVDRASEIVGKRVAELFELDVLSRHAEQFAHYRQLEVFVDALEGAGEVDPDYVDWCRAVLKRENPVPNLAIPTPPELDRQEHKKEIEAVAKTLVDTEFSAWSSITFEPLVQQDSDEQTGTGTSITI